MSNEIPKSYLDYSFSPMDEEWWLKQHSVDFELRFGSKIRDYSNGEEPRYLDNIPDGVIPIGIWKKRNFQHPYFFGRPPKGTVGSAEIIEYSNGGFLVKPVGWSFTWKNENGYCVIWDDIDTAIYDVEMRTKSNNYKAYKSEVGWTIFKALLGAGLIYYFIMIY